MRRHTGANGAALRARLAIGAIGVWLVLAVGAPAARADTCAITDLTCIANHGGNTVGGVAQEGKDTLGGVVDKGKDTVNRVLNGRSGGSGGSGGSGSGGSGSGGAPGSGGGGGTGIAGRTFSTSHATTANAPGAQNVAAHQRRSGLLRSFGGTVATTAKVIGFPLILGIVVALFVAFQNRLDRHDPKLARAPLTPDRQRFV